LENNFIAHMIAFVSDKCKNGKETYRVQGVVDKNILKEQLQ
jgi:hypothetical protein